MAVISNLAARYGSAIWILASCEETQTAPLTSDDPSTAIFQSLMAAPPEALMGRVASSLLAGMVALLPALVPGGLKSMRMLMGPLKPDLRSAFTLRSIEPFCTSGT